MLIFPDNSFGPKGESCVRTSLFVVSTACLLSATPAMASDDFDWRRLSDQKGLVTAFENMSNMCTELGFARQPKLPAETMQKKVEAYLLLATSADSVLERWSGMLHAFNQLDRTKSDCVTDAQFQRSDLARQTGKLTSASQPLGGR